VTDGPDDWAAFLAERPIAVLATIGRDGDVHAVAVEVVVHEGTPHVWCESWSVKARNAQRNGRATIMAYKGQVGAMVRGAVTPIRAEDPSYDEITTMFLRKYDREEEYGNDLVLAIAPDHITTWG
jgi:hypothetical protein